jgi:hypothetical protein
VRAAEPSAPRPPPGAGEASSEERGAEPRRGRRRGRRRGGRGGGGVNPAAPAGSEERAASPIPDIGDSGRFAALDVEEYERTAGGNGSSAHADERPSPPAPFELSPPSSEGFSAPAPRPEPERAPEPRAVEPPPAPRPEAERLPEPRASFEPRAAEPPPAPPAPAAEPLATHERPPGAG